MKSLRKILMERLVAKGMEVTVIPAYIRDLVRILADNSLLSLRELNGKLHSIGWDDLELDDYTLQLVTAIFEPDLGSRLPHRLDGILDDEALDQLADKRESLLRLSRGLFGPLK